MIRGPEESGAYWRWWDSADGVEVRFVGRGPAASRQRILHATGPAPEKVAWPLQRHTATVLEAKSGLSGEGDALVTRQRDLALCVASADCVPVLLAKGDRASAVHAGWRGIVAEVLTGSVERLGDAHELTAWIGPAIGACCYQVGEEVAEAVVAASGPETLFPQAGGRPHLDLSTAAALQLAASGVRSIHRVATCTRCDAVRLWSYRREGKGAGRNLAFIWIRGGG